MHKPRYYLKTKLKLKNNSDSNISRRKLYRATPLGGKSEQDESSSVFGPKCEVNSVSEKPDLTQRFSRASKKQGPNGKLKAPPQQTIKTAFDMISCYIYIYI